MQPRAVLLTLEPAHLAVRDHVGTAHAEVVEELMRERAEVHVGSGGHPGRSEGLTGASALHQQRRPLVDHTRVLAVLDAGEKRLILQRLVPLLEEGDILLATHERHVRRRVDERRGSIQRALFDERRPELTALLELLVDRDRLGGIDRAVGRFGRVVQLAQGGVTGARVVPRVGALQPDVVKPLVDDDLPVGLQL